MKENYDHQKFIYEDLIDDFDPTLSDISSLSTVHDRYQFESKFNYDLNGDENSEKNYEVDIYFFIPKNIGINRDTYTREDFYGDIVNYLRISSTQKQDNRDLLPNLKKYFAVHLTTRKRQKLIQLVIQDIKLFGCSFNSELKNLHYGLFQVLNKKSHEIIQRVDVLQKLLVDFQKTLQVYRDEYVEKLRQQMVVVDSEVKRALFLVDEYNSYRLETTLISIFRLLQPYEDHFSEIKTTIENILHGEINYRSKVNITNIDEGDDAVREYYHYRMGLLKKYVSSALYLQVTNIKNDKKYRNIVAGIGAALAALWASLANVHYWQVAQVGQTANLQLMTIIIIGVVAYVFKDRIKDWSKSYFNEQLKHRLPDFDRHMYYTRYDANGEKQQYFLGKSTEYMRYLQKKAVSPDVLYVREMGHDSEIEPQRHEMIIHYSKTLKLQRGNLEGVPSIKDVVRFNFAKFLSKLDNPSKSLSYFDRNKGIISIEAPKVYHINVVFRYVVCEKKNKEIKYTRNIELERIRIILNKKGILRVEEVIPRGEMNYQEAQSEH
ncbi:hypothetical protein [Candidatus Uabimicrobium amorphum]|uniref:Uncharacterized protein n=1 Tax=Uabimicrobium amorphum TaxID=2596890 RepID=A0A5S9IKJ6_UABAM|nr:hypothetical protein [Candidatus Uabimicrobium amorphum]BBM83237.1 hypothetical protein UABAM_01588 [Candidatus Uabimicrobium amorphum]